MGKNKGAGKKRNVFKVAGAKSLKSKSKAKPVIGNLKKINEIVRKNVVEIDKELVNLQTDIRKKAEKVEKSTLNSAGKSEKKFDKKNLVELEGEKQKTLEKFSRMEF